MAIDYVTRTNRHLREIDEELKDTLKRIDNSATTLYKIGTLIEGKVTQATEDNEIIRFATEELDLFHQPKEGILDQGGDTFYGYDDGVPYKVDIESLKTLRDFQFQIPDGDIKEWVKQYGARDSRFGVTTEDIFNTDVFNPEQVYEIVDAYRSKHKAGELEGESLYSDIMLEDSIVAPIKPPEVETGTEPVKQGPPSIVNELGEFYDQQALDKYLEEAGPEDLDLSVSPFINAGDSLDAIDDIGVQNEAAWTEFSSTWDLASAGRYGDKYIAIVNGKPAHVNESEFYMIQRFGDDAANWIHKNKIESDEGVTINPITGLPEYYQQNSGMVNLTSSLTASSAFFGSATGTALLAAEGATGIAGAFGAGGALSGMGAGLAAMAPVMAIAGPILLGIAWIAGADAKAQAMRAKRKAAKAGVKNIKHAQGRQARRIDEGLSQMVGGLQQQMSGGREDFGQNLGKVQMEKEKNIKQTKGLYTSTAENKAENALENIQSASALKQSDLFTKYEQDQWSFLQREREQMEKLGLDLEEMYRKVRSTRGKTDWHENLF